MTAPKPTPAPETEPGAAPNILLVMADQMTPFLLEACGHAGARMAHLSALAERSVRFRTAYTPSPICTPARSCLMTGRHTSATGCYDNGDPFPAYIPTFAHYLADAGYETVLAGKMHFIGPDQLHGFRRRLNGDIYPTGFLWSYPLPPEQDPDWQAFDFVAQYQAQNIGPGQSEELRYDDDTQARALEFLRAAPEHPWMLTVSFTNPHPPYVVPQGYWDLYKDADLPLPVYPDDMDARYSGFDRALRRWHGLERGDIRAPEHLMAMRRGYAALAHYVDDKLGALLAALEARGQRERTVVIFTSDHGEMLGEHGLIQKRSFYEWSARIPLFIDMPGAAPRDVDVPVSLIDLPATLVALAGQSLAAPMDGRSLLPALQGGELPVVPVISEYHGEGIMRPSFMVRQDRWKLIWSEGSAPQLFDLEADPGEWHNRAGNPDCAAVLAALEAEITGGRFDLARIGREVWDRLPMKAVVNRAMAANGTGWQAGGAEAGAQSA